MNCPACKEPLIVLEHEDIEVDYCLACEGIWLDTGELELLFGDARKCGEFIAAGNPAHAQGEATRRCPICRKNMAKAVTGGDHPIVYDRCGRGDGLWFDKGELLEVLTRGAPRENDDPVVKWLRALFDRGKAQ